jgi:outer membrane autotransporter protein
VLARDHAGLYAAFGTLRADVQREFRDLGSTAGSITMGAVSVGGYWTHYGPGGWYIDAVTQGTWCDADAPSVTGPLLHTHGFGWAGSLEGGYPIAVAQRLLLEPQAQLMYQRVRLNDGSDQDALVSFSDSDALQGRLGARLVKPGTSARRSIRGRSPLGCASICGMSFLTGATRPSRA